MFDARKTRKLRETAHGYATPKNERAKQKAWAKVRSTLILNPHLTGEAIDQFRVNSCEEGLTEIISYLHKGALANANKQDMIDQAADSVRRCIEALGTLKATDKLVRIALAKPGIGSNQETLEKASKENTANCIKALSGIDSAEWKDTNKRNPADALVEVARTVDDEGQALQCVDGVAKHGNKAALVQIAEGEKLSTPANPTIAAECLQKLEALDGKEEIVALIDYFSQKNIHSLSVQGITHLKNMKAADNLFDLAVKHPAFSSPAVGALRDLNDAERIEALHSDAWKILSESENLRMQKKDELRNLIGTCEESLQAMGAVGPQIRILTKSNDPVSGLQKALSLKETFNITQEDNPTRWENLQMAVEELSLRLIEIKPLLKILGNASAERAEEIEQLFDAVDASGLIKEPIKPFFEQAAAIMSEITEHQQKVHTLTNTYELARNTYGERLVRLKDIDRLNGELENLPQPNGGGQQKTESENAPPAHNPV